MSGTRPGMPLAPGIGWLFQDLRRRSLEQAVRIETHGVPREPVVTAIASNHAGVLDPEVIRRIWPGPVATIARGWALRRGTAVLVFPEGGTSPDGTLGAFRAEAFDEVVATRAKGTAITVTPVALSGTHGVERQLPWGRGEADRARITVRAGEPFDPAGMTAADVADRARAAVAALLAEDRGTWWEAVRGEAEPPSGAPRWREAWRQRGDVDRPGERPALRIWPPERRR